MRRFIRDCGRTHYKPFAGMIQRLEEFSQLIECFESEEPDNLCGPGDEARDRARHLTHKNDLCQNNLAYVEVMEEERFKKYHVYGWLTDHGNACLQALKAGEVWDSTKQRVDIDETIAFHEDELRWRSLPDSAFQAVAKLPPRPEYRKLVTKFVMRKLKSEPTPGRDGEWQEIKAA